MSITASCRTSALSTGFLACLTLCLAPSLWAQAVSGPANLTVLTYNTHLWEDTPPETFKRAENYYEDTMRRHRIVARIKGCGADIVALQEVWNYDHQSYFIKELRGTYPHAARVNSACHRAVVGNGLLLLSKWPLSDIKFTRFPTYTPSISGDWMANKGVLAATALVGDRKLRIGISHALTGEDDSKGEMSAKHLAIAPFTLGGRSYILALHKDVGANIFRIDDYRGSVDGRLHGAGKQLVKYGASMSPNYVALTSFQLKGHPYILGLHRDVGANIWRINDDPATGLNLLKRAKMSANYVAITSFELNGHPYIFGLHRDAGANIWRINDDPSTGLTLVKTRLKMSAHYVALASFQLNGHPYIFGLHRDAGANIWRINDDPSSGFTLVRQGGAWASNYRFVRSFELQGHPYLFGLKDCRIQIPEACLRPCADEAYITRIQDDPSSGWEDSTQMEDIRIIAEETLRAEGPPAVIVGDFNVHATKYPIMNSIFALAGARDAYVAVHGENMDNAETIDYPNNKLALHFNPKKTTRTESSFDRIDYVYVKESGTGLTLRPVEARVIRDWKYDDGAKRDMDLSDHYPLVVTFKIGRGAQ